MEFTAEGAVGGESLQDRSWIGEPAGLDQDTAELRHPALLALSDQPAQRNLEVGARIAAQAPVPEKGDVVGAATQKSIINPDAAEFVDDDGGARALRRGQEPANQRRLTGAEEAGNYGHRNAGAASMLEPASEQARSAGREEIEHFPTQSLDQKSISRM